MRYDTICLLICATLTAFAIGCGKSESTALSPEAMRRHSLEELGDAYSNYVKVNGRNPNSVNDFKQLDITHPAAGRALTSGDCVVLLGGTKGTDSKTVIAYEKSVPEGGGYVLMQDYSVREMTAADFNSATKVSKEVGKFKQ